MDTPAPKPRRAPRGCMQASDVAKRRRELAAIVYQGRSTRDRDPLKSGGASANDAKFVTGPAHFFIQLSRCEALSS